MGIHWLKVWEACLNEIAKVIQLVLNTFIYIYIYIV